MTDFTQSDALEAAALALNEASEMLFLLADDLTTARAGKSSIDFAELAEIATEYAQAAADAAVSAAPHLFEQPTNPPAEPDHAPPGIVHIDDHPMQAAIIDRKRAAGLITDPAATTSDSRDDRPEVQHWQPTPPRAQKSAAILSPVETLTDEAIDAIDDPENCTDEEAAPVIELRAAELLIARATGAVPRQPASLFAKWIEPIAQHLTDRENTIAEAEFHSL